MTNLNTTAHEKISLEAHVDLCAQRYSELYCIINQLKEEATLRDTWIHTGFEKIEDKFTTLLYSVIGCSFSITMAILFKH